MAAPVRTVTAMNDQKVKGGEASGYRPNWERAGRAHAQLQTICNKDVKEKKELPPTHTN